MNHIEGDNFQVSIKNKEGDWIPLGQATDVIFEGADVYPFSMEAGEGLKKQCTGEITLELNKSSGNKIMKWHRKMMFNCWLDSFKLVKFFKKVLTGIKYRKERV